MSAGNPPSDRASDEAARGLEPGSGERLGWALILGGTGAVGRELVRELARAGLEIVFSWHRNAALAAELERAHRAPRASGISIDLADAARRRRFLEGLLEDRGPPALIVHAAAHAGVGSLSSLDDREWDRLQQISGGCVIDLARVLGPAMGTAGGGEIVLLGALDRMQSIPLPAGYAAMQGMLSALTMALGHELGPQGVHVNLVALGLLDGGLSRLLDPKLREDYLRFSALRRLGEPAEAARAIAHLALGSGYMNGKILPFNGGI
ncbi:MAG: SDR family oxidoreductase [Myxococcales bacterium]|nr:SDR family oxidoreductase [Myxococcales bacterium]